MKTNDINSLNHMSWNCKYYIVFAPKYRRKIFYGEKRVEIGKILRELCNWKQVKINRSRSVSGSYTYACGNPTENEYIKYHGIFEI